MRTFGVWTCKIALAVGLGAGMALAADGPSNDAKADTAKGNTGRASGWWSRAKKKAPAKKADAKQAKGTPKTEPEASKKASPASEEAAARTREQANYLRRSEVCLKLLEIAYETNDDELRRLAEQLEERAQRTYAQRTPTMPSGDDAFVSDEQTLKKHLGPADRAAGRPVSTRSYRVTGKDATARKSEREERP